MYFNFPSISSLLPLPDVEKIMSFVFKVIQPLVSQSQNFQFPMVGQGAVLSVFQSNPRGSPRNFLSSTIQYLFVSYQMALFLPS